MASLYRFLGDMPDGDHQRRAVIQRTLSLSCGLDDFLGQGLGGGQTAAGIQKPLTVDGLGCTIAEHDDGAGIFQLKIFRLRRTFASFQTGRQGPGLRA